MLRDAAVSRIQRILHFRSDKSTEIVEELQNAQTYYEKRPNLPWFLLTTIQDLATVATVETVALPSSPVFLREYDEDALFYFNSAATADADKWTELAKDDLDFLRETYPGSGAPKAYALVNENFYIFPTPDAAYTLKFIYYAEDTKLDTNVENEWLKHYPDLLIGYAGRMIAPPLSDAEAKAQFVEMETEARALLQAEIEAREHTNREYIMGGPD